jgi:uncharacterized protein
MKNGFSIYDTHTHAGRSAHNGRSYSVEQLLSAMDQSGVDRSLVIPFPVIEDCRKAHDTIAAAVNDYPDRLAGAAYVYPVTTPAAFRDEVRRCALELGFKALKIQPQYQPFHPMQKSSEYFFEAAAEFGLPVICHTGSGVPNALPSLLMAPARAFPELKIILAHSGGGMFSSEAVVAAMFCPNIYLELSSLMPTHLRQVFDSIPSSRLMIGSDLPENLETELFKILSMCEADEIKRDVLWNTAAGVFGVLHE